MILVRPFTEADDVAGLPCRARDPDLARAARRRTRRSSPAAWAVPAVTGAADAGDRSRRAARCAIGDVVLHEGDLIAIDGTTGAVTTDDVPLVEPEIDERVRDGARAGPTSCAGSACARTPTRPRTPRGARVRRRGDRAVPHRAHVHRRERQPKMRRDDHGRRRRGAPRARSRAAAAAAGATSRGCSRRWTGLPVTIRLLDPPLHEFLPDRVELHERGRARADRAQPDASTASSAARARAASSRRPTRCSARAACRLGHPAPGDLRDAGARDRPRRASPCASAPAAPRGRDHDPAGRLRARARAHARRWSSASPRRRVSAPATDFSVGTMIELPRACFIADQIARARRLLLVRHQRPDADARSGFSRDDIEGRILARYIDEKIVDRSPFETIDLPGVGRARADRRVARAASERQTSSSASAASTAATPTRSASSTTPASTT